MAFDHGHALIVGVGGDLPMTATDARSVASLLSDPARAAYRPDHVCVLTENEATRDGIRSGFAALKEAVTKDSLATALIFLSGHGYRIGAAHDNARYFFVPSGFDLADPEKTGISDDELTDAIASIGAKRLFVLLDCCYAAALPKDATKGAHAIVKAGLPSKVLARLGEGEGEIVLTSCADDQLSYAFEGEPNSVFTRCLLDALTGGVPARNGLACVLDVAAYVMDAVPKRVANQNPVLNKATKLSLNLPLCAMPKSKAIAGAPVRRARVFEEHAIELQIEAIRPAWELSINLAGKVRVALALEGDPKRKLALERDLARAEEDAAKYGEDLGRLFDRLGRSAE